MDYSQIESNSIVLNISTKPLEEILRDCISIQKLQAEERELKLDYSISPTCPEIITTDTHRLQQIIINLISNSIKYTLKHGEVCLNADYKDSKILISVIDTGVGIDQNELKKLFKPYTKIMSNRSLNKQGCGLGLTISRLLANALGGDIQVESEVAKGSKFTVVLPQYDEEFEKNIGKF